jgi:tetratricopeptide (TPR) repeat protein
VADALEELFGEDPGERVGELAYHWAHATQPRDTEKAMIYAQRAGDRALDQLAPDEALRWYRDALDLLDRAPADDRQRRTELLLGLGDAQRQTGDAAHRETLLTAAHLADDIDVVDLLVQATLRNSRGLASSIGEIDDERIEMITRALARLGDADSPDKARLLALLCAERQFDSDSDGRLALATQAVEIARRTGDGAALVDAIAICHEAISRPRTLELRRTWTSEACEVADGLGDPIARLRANNFRRLAALEEADLATMNEASLVFESEAERIDQPFNHWYLALHRASRFSLEGELAAAEQTANEALALGTAADQPDALGYYGAQLVDVRNKQGRLHELVPLIEQAVEDNPGLPIFRAVQVRAKSRDDTDHEVAGLIDLEVVNNFPMSEDLQWLTAHVLWAEGAAICRHRPAAAILYERLLPWHAQFATTHVTMSGGVAHYLGLLAHALDRYDEADKWFGEAMACHEGMQSPYFVAFTQTAWAALLCDRHQPGDTQRARMLIDAALPIAARRGYGYVEQDARELLERMESLPPHESVP